jgi:hypothetical protein
MMDLVKYEKLVYDTYLNIKEALMDSNLSGLLDEKDVPFFFSMLDVLIRDEAEHSGHITNYVGHMDRIH